MRIAFFTERLLPGHGLDVVVWRLARGLAERGHQVRLWYLAGDPPEEPGPLEVEKVAIFRDPRYLWYEWGALRRFRYLAKREKDAEVWMLCSIPFYQYAYLLRRWTRDGPRPWILEAGIPPADGLPYRIRRNFWWMKFLRRWLYFPAAERIVCISHYLRDQLPEMLQARSVVVYPGADHYRAEGSSLREELGIPGNAVVFGYLGRLDPRVAYKGLEKLVRYFRALREKVQTPVRLLLVGPSEPRLRRFRVPDVLYLTDVPAGQMGRVLRTLDVVVSASYWEGLNLPLLEGQAFGKPVIAFAVGPHGEVVREDVTGFLARSEKDFVNAMRVLAEDAALRARMGREAHAHAMRFRWRYAVDALERALQMK